EAETFALVDGSRAWSSARARMRALDVAGRDFTFRHGRPLSAVDCYRELLEVGERVGSRAARAEACSQLALCLALVGAIEGGDEARALLREVASVLARMEPHDHAVPGSVWFAAAAAWQLGDAAAAAWLSPLVERQEAAGGPPGPMALLDQAAGRIAALRGDTE